jgi:hypothetical protein
VYPGQTSLIPTQIALIKFWQQGGNIGGNYPYWYLGTTPYRYLTGPILPLFVSFLQKIFSSLSLFDVFWGITIFSWLVGIFGVFLLMKELGGEDKKGPFLAALFYAFGPLVPFLFPFSNGLSLISFSFLPFVWRAYLKFLKSDCLKTSVNFASWVIFLLLLDLAMIPSMFLGIATLFLAQAGWQKAERRVKRSLKILFFGFLIVTFWYTLGYWRNALGGPSLAGKGRLAVIFQVVKLLPTTLALAMGILTVKFFKKRNLRRDFIFVFLFVFGFLTLLRLTADPDFWQDWLAYGKEWQLGVAMGLAWLLTNGPVKSRQRGSKVLALVLAGLFFITWLFLIDRDVLKPLQKDIFQTVEYRLGQELDQKMRPGERVFLSGTTVFWLNAFFDLSQVRGGVDQASVNSDWRKAVWEIREGEDPEKSLAWLKKLKIDYLVVHSQASSEFYHDFKNPEKFAGIEAMKLVYDKEGDKIYRVKWIK